MLSWSVISLPGFSQSRFSLPSIELLKQSIDAHFQTVTQIQTEEIRQTTRFRWLSYLPNPGYSPFTGGFTASLNFAAPLQEIRQKKATRVKTEAIHLNNLLSASDLKSSITVDYNHILNLISENNTRNSLDSLHSLTYDIARKKYDQNEITPTEYLTIVKAQEEFRLSRLKEETAINEAITQLLYKAKMDVPASNAHLNNLTHKGNE